MSRCIDSKYGDMLYAYELGMLSEEENRAFELHLIECQYCSHRARKFLDASDIIKHDSDLHHYVGSLAEEKTDSGPKEERTGVWLRLTRKPWPYAIPVAAAILLLLLLIDWEIIIKPGKEAVAAENRLTILYFANLPDPADEDHLSHIATNLLITDLGESKYFRVTSSTRLRDICDRLGIINSQSGEGDTPFKIARESGAKWILTGEILKTAPEIIITSQLLAAATGDVLASQQVAGKPGQDIFSVIDLLSREIKKDLPLPIPARQEVDRSISDITTRSQEAYLHYLNGVEFQTRFYTAKAVEEFKKALEYDSTMAMAYYCLADLEDRELIYKAREFSEHISRREKYLIQASYSLISGKESEAIEALQMLVAEYPDEPYAYWRLGRIYQQLGQSDRAISYYEEAIAVDPYYRNAYNSLAYAYDAAGDLEKSILAINKYIDIAPGEANPYDTRGDFYSRRGELDKAIESYIMALRINPDYFISLEKLGFQYLYERKYGQADSCFRVLAEKADGVTAIHARFMLVATHLRQGKFAYALAIIDSLAAIDLENNDFVNASYQLSLKSQILTETGQFEDAITTARRCRELLSPDSLSLSVSSQGALVQTLAEAGKIEEARSELEILRSLLQKAGMPQAHFWYSKGFVEFFDRNFDLAIDAFGMDTQSVFGFLTPYMLARSYFEGAHYDLAAEKFESLLNDYGNRRLMYAIPNVKIHYYLGRTFEESRWYKKAIEQYEEFLSLWENTDTNLDIVADARERLKRLKQHL